MRERLQARPRADSGTKTRGESADSPLTTMPDNSHAGTLLGSSHYQDSYQDAPSNGLSIYQALAKMVAAHPVKLGHPNRDKTDNICRRRAAESLRSNSPGSRRSGADRIRATSRGPKPMKTVRATVLIIALAAATATGGCGEKSHRSASTPAHGASSSAPEPAPPTPDTTPIDALRTPAGLVLKIDQPTPLPSVTPAPTP